MELTRIGLYTLQQAARLSGAKASEVNRWLFGYKSNNGKSFLPLWQTQIKDIDQKIIGFRDLLELRIVSAFIRKGVPLQVIRSSLENAQEMFGTDYPLTSLRFLTDGKRIYHEALKKDSALTDLAKRQLVFSSVIRPSLYDGIEFTASGKATRWYPLRGKAVVVDPELSFGRPSLTNYGIPTEIIAQALKAERGDIKAVSSQFAIPPSEVKAAAKFESQLLAA